MEAVQVELLACICPRSYVGVSRGSHGPSTPYASLILTTSTYLPALIQPGDVLIHAGDLIHCGTPSELRVTFDWLVSFPHKHKIVKASNHNTYLQTHERRLWAHCWRERGIIYLEDKSYTIQVHSHTFNIFGSPCTPRHGNFAFQYTCAGMTGSPPHGRWSIIPDDTHILVAHEHPHGHLDLTGLGCRVPPARLLMLPVFGHVHGGRGIEVLLWNPVHQNSGVRTISVNSSVVGGSRDGDVRSPIVIDI
ncbi:hypothetical protein K503DRAFT_791429 [Rhizopogon vinicolor AM-OR11-026]|uniref:Calcineurin-like phosphoesterase domain-containing protein n=1 Tax=Rhizopogon vinicolor AM-OR11-026 TaxID=1314800 RepID=A0A1B7N693_9AGAM|nr:hypothetical protein K503DRAFT_791429 [Rhizopogon vinicolor AM-OR11-026]